MGAAHPMRDSTPEGEQYTRRGAVHPDRTGAMHTDRVSRPHQQAQPRHTVACRSTHAARRDTRNRCGWLDSLRCVRVRWLVGYRRGLRGCLCDTERGVSAWVAVLRVRQ